MSLFCKPSAVYHDEPGAVNFIHLMPFSQSDQAVPSVHCSHVPKNVELVLLVI